MKTYTKTFQILTTIIVILSMLLPTSLVLAEDGSDGSGTTTYVGPVDEDDPLVPDSFPGDENNNGNTGDECAENDCNNVDSPPNNGTFDPSEGDDGIDTAPEVVVVKTGGQQKINIFVPDGPICDEERDPYCVNWNPDGTISVISNEGSQDISHLEFWDLEQDPTQTPTEQPTETPTEQPTQTPTEQPTETPTEQPTETPTEQPTQTPTEQPTQTPTEQPTETPTEQPTQTPTEQPTQTPTEQPTQTPTEQPTETPTEEPTPTTPPPTISIPVTGSNRLIPLTCNVGCSFARTIYPLDNEDEVRFYGELCGGGILVDEVLEFELPIPLGNQYDYLTALVTEVNYKGEPIVDVLPEGLLIQVAFDWLDEYEGKDLAILWYDELNFEWVELPLTELLEKHTDFDGTLYKGKRLYGDDVEEYFLRWQVYFGPMKLNVERENMLSRIDGIDYQHTTPILLDTLFEEEQLPRECSQYEECYAGGFHQPDIEREKDQEGEIWTLMPDPDPSAERQFDTENLLYRVAPWKAEFVFFEATTNFDGVFVLVEK
ncbi:MAG: hypothetical protein JW750_04410 [Anaerolineaceae bacterium]|nr:hypothetical protein [Anaerolineaceae bacterium]